MLTDLADVTRVLIRLLREGISTHPAWTGAGVPDVVSDPPDQVSGHNLGLYLYHVTEDPSLKNIGPTGPRSDVALMPMALVLHYVMVPDTRSGDDGSPLTAQGILSAAMKTFHDYPIITDSTIINGVHLLREEDLDGRGNKIHIVHRPTSPDDAVSYWTAGTGPLRLSTYYEASVIFLEPEVDTTRAQRVLQPAVHSFVTGAPRLFGSQSELEFLIPGAAEPEHVEVSPAEVPIGASLRLNGVNLVADDLSVLLDHKNWPEPIQVDERWGVTPTQGGMSMTIRESLPGVAIYPGVYMARALVTTRRAMPDGSTREFRFESNQTPFLVTPAIDAVAGLPGPDLVLTGGLFDDPNRDPADDPLDAAVHLGADSLTRADPLVSGSFRIPSPTSLELRLPAGLSETIPLRVVIEGAENAPLWIEL